VAQPFLAVAPSKDTGFNGRMKALSDKYKQIRLLPQLVKSRPWKFAPRTADQECRTAISGTCNWRLAFWRGTWQTLPRDHRPLP
jgi:hypothetical protein